MWVPRVNPQALFALTLALIVIACGDDGGTGTHGLGPDPDAGPSGASPEVVDCGRGAACPDGQRCDPFVGCVECLFDTDCEPTEICNGRHCETGALCRTSSECRSLDGSPAVCDPA